MRKGRPSENAPIGAFSQPDAAKLLNVGRTSIQRAALVRGEGAPELQKAVEAGGVSLWAAEAIAQQPEEQQREIVMRGDKAVAEAAKAIRAQRIPGERRPKPAGASNDQAESFLARLRRLVDGQHHYVSPHLGVLDLSVLGDEAGRDVRVRQWLLPSRFLSRRACCAGSGS